MIILSKDKLKRSRTPRGEINNYSETVKYIDIVLRNLKPTEKKISNKYMTNKKLSEIHSENKLFKFGIKSAQRFLDRAVEKANARCIPGGQKVTWKDLRSSMACDLLKKDWSRDEVNARLGHKPSSRIIDRYINYLALDRKKPKKKIYESNLRKIEAELESSKEFSKLQSQRLEKQNQKYIEELSFVKQSNEELSGQLKQIKEEYNNVFQGKNFMKLLVTLANKQKEISKLLEQVGKNKFDVVLKSR